MTPRTLAVCSALAAVLCTGAVAVAGGTKSLRYTTYREFDPEETKGVLISSQGELSAGFGSRKVDIKVPFVRASVTAPDGTIYLGTGDQGEVWAYAKGNLRKVAKIDTPVISTMALGPDGKVYCGTVADGRVVALDPGSGSWKQVVQLGKKGEGHVWALAWDASRNVLWAGTGPKGELYAIEKGVAKQVWSSTEKHLLSLQVAHDGSGALYVGSGERANLYRVEKDGRARVLHAFAADEIHALVEKNGSLFVAVNEFSGGGAPFGGMGGTRITFGPGSPAVPAKAPLPRMGTRAGKGAVYRWDPDGRIDQLYAAPDTWLAGVFVEGNGDVMAAAGGKGSVYLIKADRTVLTAYEFPQRQVLVMELRGPVKLFGTGDQGALHLLEPGAPKDSVFTAKVFDATFPTRFGGLRWSGAGRFTFEVRTGNTAKPDKTWSGWGKLEGVVAMGEIGSGRVRAGDVRHLQWRVKFGSARAVLRHLTLYYLQQNQRPRLTEVTIGDAAPGGAPGGFGGFGGAAAAARPPKSTMVKIRWKVDNPDGDTLNYRLFVREEKDPVWKPLGGPEPMLGKVEFDWQTEAIPDGHYLAKVVVTDEPSNPKGRVLVNELVSAVPYLLDQRRPEISGLEVRYPFLAGRARDSYSVLTELAYSIDGGDWVPFDPADGIFDSTAKTFAVRLPDNLLPGQHTVAVRTADEANNVGVAQVAFRVGK